MVLAVQRMSTGSVELHGTTIITHDRPVYDTLTSRHLPHEQRSV